VTCFIALTATNLGIAGIFVALLAIGGAYSAIAAKRGEARRRNHREVVDDD
jgi:hypothetical protein